MIPNMYKIAGERTAAVFHVAARSLAVLVHVMEAIRAAGRLKVKIEANGLRQTELIGPVPSFFAKENGEYRYQNGWSVNALVADHRREEIARMLAGAEITAEARAAAERLLRAATA